MTDEMTIENLRGDEIQVIELSLPSDAGPALLAEARYYCLELIEWLEAIAAYPPPFSPSCYPIEYDFGEIIEEPYGGKLAYDVPGYMQRALRRLAEIDRALISLGFEPEKCDRDGTHLH